MQLKFFSDHLQLGKDTIGDNCYTILKFCLNEWSADFTWPGLWTVIISAGHLLFTWRKI